MNEHLYIASILRYRSQVLSPEVVNLGVLVFVPYSLEIRWVLPETFTRFKAAFPQADHAYIERLLKGWRWVSKDVKKLNEIELLKAADSSDRKRLWQSIVNSVFLPVSDNNLYFEAPIEGHFSGLSVDGLADYLNEQILVNYGEKRLIEHKAFTTLKIKRTVTHEFKPLLDRFKDKITENYTVKIGSSTAIFPFAWPNKSLHLVKPLSLDLKEPVDVDSALNATFGQAVRVLKAAEEPVVIDLITSYSPNKRLRRKAEIGIEELKAELDGNLAVKPVQEFQTYVAHAQHELELHHSE